MNYTISFQEKAKLSLEQLSKQSPVTLEMARNQVQKLKTQSKSENKKQRNYKISFLRNPYGFSL